MAMNPNLDADTARLLDDMQRELAELRAKVRENSDMATTMRWSVEHLEQNVVPAVKQEAEVALSTAQDAQDTSPVIDILGKNGIKVTDDRQGTYTIRQQEYNAHPFMPVLDGKFAWAGSGASRPVRGELCIYPGTWTYWYEYSGTIYQEVATWDPDVDSITGSFSSEDTYYVIASIVRDGTQDITITITDTAPNPYDVDERVLCKVTVVDYGPSGSPDYQIKSVDTVYVHENIYEPEPVAGGTPTTTDHEVLSNRYPLPYVGDHYHLSYDHYPTLTGDTTGNGVEDTPVDAGALHNHAAEIATHASADDAHHDPVSLSPAANTALLSLAGQILSLDTQADNTVFAGPAGGGPATPSFRVLDHADLNQGTLAVDDHHSHAIKWWNRNAAPPAYQDNRPMLFAGSFWFLKEIAVNGNVIEFRMDQTCLPLYNVPGFDPYTSGAGEKFRFIDPSTGDIEESAVTSGRLGTPPGNWYDGTIRVVDPATGDSQYLTFTSGYASASDEGVYAMPIDTSGNSITIRITESGGVYIIAQ